MRFFDSTPSTWMSSSRTAAGGRCGSQTQASIDLRGLGELQRLAQATPSPSCLRRSGKNGKSSGTTSKRCASAPRRSPNWCRRPRKNHRLRSNASPTAIHAGGRWMAEPLHRACHAVRGAALLPILCTPGGAEGALGTAREPLTQRNRGAKAASFCLRAPGRSTSDWFPSGLFSS